MTNQVLLTRFRLDNSQAITQARAFEKAIRDQNTQMVQTGNAAAAMGRSAKANAANMNNMRRMIGQASFQVADFAIVMNQGQNALRAFAIQGGQLAGSLGPLGAVIGGVITVGGLLLHTFLENADGAKELEDALKGLREEVDKLRFGPSEQEVNLNKQAEALTRELEELNRVIISTRSEFAGSKRDLEDIEIILQDMVGSEIERREEIQKQLAEIAKTRAFLEREKEALDDILGSTEGLAAETEALNEIYDEQIKKQEAILGLLMAQVQAVVDRAAAEAALPGGYQQQLDSEVYGAGQEAMRKLLAEGYTLPEVETKSTGGGGRSQVDRMREDIEQLLPQVQEAIDSYQSWTDLMIGDFKAGFVSVTESGVGAFVDAIAEADFSFQEFAKNFLRSISKMILQQSLLNILTMAFPGAGFGGTAPPLGIVPHAKGGVIGGPTMFAMGGSNKLGIAGEAGPEAIMPLSRDSSGRLGVAAAAPQIEVHNYAGAQVEVSMTPDEIIQVAVRKSVDASRGEFMRQMNTGSGGYSKAFEQGYKTRRRTY